MQILYGLQDDRNTTKTRQKHYSGLKGLAWTYWPEATKEFCRWLIQKKTSVTKVQHSKPETPMDKTRRIVRKMANDDAEQRQDKTIRLRKAMILPSRFVSHSALSLTISDLIEGELSYTFSKSPNQPSSF